MLSRTAMQHLLGGTARIAALRATSMIVATVVSVAACQSSHEEYVPAGPALTTGGATTIIAVRAQRLKFYPCSKCHAELPPRSGVSPPRGPHRDMTFNHSEATADCTLCHDTAHPDGLLLLTHEQISFDESYKLCGQCHGERYRDWKSGAHGKVVGSWLKEQTKLPCAACHDPHDPQFHSMKSLPPMPLPRFAIPRGGSH